MLDIFLSTEFDLTQENYETYNNLGIQEEMRRLPESFVLHRYGLDVRLANEADSEFILSLRTDDKLSRFIHSTDNNMQKQQQWMKDYKEREDEGEDYYFIYSFEGIPLGVNRIYDIKEDSATGGSWLCKKGTEVEHSIATLLIMRDILFDQLQLQYDKFDIRKGNKKVQRLHQQMGAKKTGETDLDYLYTLSKDDYHIAKKNIIQLLNIEE